MTSFFMFPAFSGQIIYTVGCMCMYICYASIVTKLYSDTYPKLFFFFIPFSLFLIAFQSGPR